MKWAQLKKVLDDDGVVDVDERKKLFKEYQTKKDLKKDLSNPKKFEKWVTYPGPENGFKEFGALNRKAQRRYEVFCGGFLYYHDEIFKQYKEGAGYEYPDPAGPNIAPKWKEYIGIDTDGKQYIVKDFEHKIYFRWLRDNEDEDIEKEEDNEQNEEKKKGKNKVIIYITPTPAAFNSRPPVPPAPPPPESNP